MLRRARERGFYGLPSSNGDVDTDSWRSPPCWRCVAVIPSVPKTGAALVPTAVLQCIYPDGDIVGAGGDLLNRSRAPVGVSIEIGDIVDPRLCLA